MKRLYMLGNPSDPDYKEDLEKVVERLSEYYLLFNPSHLCDRKYFSERISYLLQCDGVVLVGSSIKDICDSYSSRLEYDVAKESCLDVKFSHQWDILSDNKREKVEEAV